MTPERAAALTASVPAAATAAAGASASAWRDTPPPRRGGQGLRRRRRSRLATGLRRAALPLALAALPAAAAAWLLTSPRFALARVEVSTGGRVERAWVRRTLAPLWGENLVRLSLAEVDRLLAEHPWVEGVEIHKALPDRLEVAVRERRPAALVEREGGLWYADAEGGLIAPAGAGEHPELPRVRELRRPFTPEEGAGVPAAAAEPRAPGVPGALAALAELAACQPAWAAGLVEIGVLGEEDFAFTTTALPFPLLVRRGEVEARSRWLAALLPEILERYERLDAVDLRFSRRIVLRPTSGPAPAAPGREKNPIEPAATAREVLEHA